jgi:hypothetical protein
MRFWDEGVRRFRGDLDADSAPPRRRRPAAGPQKVARDEGLVREMAVVAANIDQMLADANGYEQLFDDVRDWRGTASKPYPSNTGLSWGLWQNNRLASLGRVRDWTLQHAELRQHVTREGLHLTADEWHGLRRPEAY